MSNEDWTQQLRNHLADHEEAAPEGLWQAIEQTLDHQAESRPRARILPITRIAAVAAALLCLVLGGIYVYRSAYLPAEDAMPSPNRQTAPLAEKAIKHIKDNSISDYQANFGERQLVKAKSLIAFATSVRQSDAEQATVNHLATNDE